jgi:glycosyltransferase involved in cell wall biosynthesis
MVKIRVALMGPSLQAVSGVSTHLNQLFGSDLAKRFDLLHFQVGSEGRRENGVQKLIRFAFSPLAFFAFLLRQRAAIVHLNTSMVPKAYWRDTAYLLIACLLGRKVVYQVHGGDSPEAFFAGNRLLTGLLRWVLKRPDVIVLLGQDKQNDYRRFVPGQRLEVVPNAIDCIALTAESLAAKPEGSLHLVFLGRLVDKKGIFKAVEALAMLIRQGRELRLTIGGSGPDEGRLRARVNALGLDERVDFTGPVFGEDKDRLWRAAHVFVFPTEYREGLPYALLEAMAAGAVPIITNVGAIPDVMQDGVHGLFVEVGDAVGLVSAIAQLDDDRALLSRMAQAGRARVLAHYTLARLADDFTRVYESLGVKV